MILWVNLVTDSFPALSLGTEKAERDVMQMPPRKSNSSLFAGQMGKDIIIQGIMQTALVMLSYLLGQYVLTDGVQHHAEPMTMAFISLCFIQLFHAFNLRSQRNSVLNKNFFSNKPLNLSALIGVALTLFVVLTPGVKTVFIEGADNSFMLSWVEWLVSIAVAVAIIPLVEIQKLIEKKLAQKKGK